VRARLHTAPSRFLDPSRSAVTALLLLLALAVASLACGRGAPPGGRGAAGGPALDARQIAALIPPRVSDRAAWGEAIHGALHELRIHPARDRACAVIAVIAQESGFRADPEVPRLAALIEERIARARDRLGPLGKPVFSRLLDTRAFGQRRTFAERLATVRTERDVDVVFRDLIAYHQASHPMTFRTVEVAGKLFDLESLAALNPITTAGSMQVSVRFAERWAREHRGDPSKVRDALYTREGGVLYGTARLFAHEAAYPSLLFRFADYNAGVYASRNAAFQAQLAKLVGKPLALDGDVLAYGPDEEVESGETETMKALALFRTRFAPELSDRRLWRDALEEKRLAFERTDSYRAVKRVYAELHGPPPYAMLPRVEIESPKLSRKRSTAWFATSVQRRYEGCLGARRP
jgi:hypothetical protein